jgi:hypothetical protein
MIYTKKWFEQNRPEIFEYCEKQLQPGLLNSDCVAAIAPIKSGKRGISICFKTLTPDAVHIYFSALDRLDEKEQLEELEENGFEVFLSRDITDLENRLDVLDKRKKPFYLHFNESDYGTDSEQTFAIKVYKRLQKEHIKVLGYSASNEEMLCSDLDPYKTEFVPPASYRGAAWFLANNLVEEAEQFYDDIANIITPQGNTALDELFYSKDKFIGVLRITQLGKKQHALEKLLLASSKNAKINLKIKVIKGGEGFDWSKHSSYISRMRESYEQDTSLRVLLVINQTCTRSTEVGFHKDIVFWHDWKSKSPYNTIIQASGRVFHYHEVGYKIKVYTEVQSFELAAGQISVNQYSGKLSRRMAQKRGVASNKRYKFVNIGNNLTDAEIQHKIDIEHKNEGTTSYGSFSRHNASKNKYDYMENWLDKNISTQHNFTDQILILDGPGKHKNSWKKFVLSGKHNKDDIIIMVRLPDVDKKVRGHKTMNNSMYQNEELNLID